MYIIDITIFTSFTNNYYSDVEANILKTLQRKIKCLPVLSAFASHKNLSKV